MEFKWNGGKILNTSVISKTILYYQDPDQYFWKPSLETGIETFENLVLISRLVLRLLELQSLKQDYYQRNKLQSWYRDLYQDF